MAGRSICLLLFLIVAVTYYSHVEGQICGGKECLNYTKPCNNGVNCGINGECCGYVEGKTQGCCILIHGGLQICEEKACFSSPEGVFFCNETTNCGFNGKCCGYVKGKTDGCCIPIYGGRLYCNGKKCLPTPATCNKTTNCGCKAKCCGCDERDSCCVSIDG